jgi:FkbM family methyltransferase
MKYGEGNELELTFLRQIIPPGGIVFDIGANIGNHSMFFSQQVGPTGLVISFEPQTVLFQMLCGNVALNSITNVMAFNEGVGEKEGYLWLPMINYSVENNFGGISLQTKKTGKQILITALDRFINMNRVDLIKIDVEGMEQEVILGARKFISKFKPFLFVENDRPDKSEALVDLIRSLGYKLYWVITPLYNPNNFANDAENIFPSIVVKNMFCHHESRDVSVTKLEAI